MAAVASVLTVRSAGAQPVTEGKGGLMGQKGKTGLVAAGLLTATLTVSAAGVAGAAAGAGASRVEVERIDTLPTGATPGSPAHFRLVEEGDRLRVTELADELDYVERMFRQASPALPPSSGPTRRRTRCATSSGS
jgi:hypothetical protein